MYENLLADVPTERDRQYFLELRNVPYRSVLKAGTAIFTAGLGGIYPAGIAIGTVVQNQVAALVGTLVWIFLGENLLVGLASLLDFDAWAEYLPFHALDAADGTGGDNLLSYWPSVVVSLGWIALLGAAGTWRTRRRDIT